MNLKLHSPIYKGKPRQRHNNLLLPPPLSKRLTLKNVATLWNNTNNDNSNSNCNIKDIDKVCSFKWLNGGGFNTQSNTKENVLSKRITKSNGWSIIEDYNNKLGLVAIGGKDSYVQLTFENINESINSLIFIILRSYGKKWQNSRVKIRVMAKNYKYSDGNNNKYSNNDTDEDIILSIELNGFHKSKTSLIYPFAYKLNETIGIGSTMVVDIQLIDGTTFKFTDMAFCYK